MVPHAEKKGYLSLHHSNICSRHHTNSRPAGQSGTPDPGEAPKSFMPLSRPRCGVLRNARQRFETARLKTRIRIVWRQRGRRGFRHGTYPWHWFSPTAGVVMELCCLRRVGEGGHPTASELPLFLAVASPRPYCSAHDLPSNRHDSDIEERESEKPDTIPLLR